jgi:hypothetical protein
LRHSEAHELLALLDPGNQALKDVDNLTANPTNDLVERLHKEIEKNKSKAPQVVGQKIELQHNLPQEKALREYFEAAGLDNKHYTTFLKLDDHRLISGNGIHTGPNSWNRQWRDFMKDNPKPDPVKIQQQALKMMKGLRWQRQP